MATPMATADGRSTLDARLASRRHAKTEGFRNFAIAGAFFHCQPDGTKKVITAKRPLAKHRSNWPKKRQTQRSSKLARSAVGVALHCRSRRAIVSSKVARKMSEPFESCPQCSPHNRRANLAASVRLSERATISIGRKRRLLWRSAFAFAGGAALRHAPPTAQFV